MCDRVLRIVLIKFDYLILRPVLTRLLPSAWLIGFYSWARKKIMPTLAHFSAKGVVPTVPVQCMGLEFRNPLGVAAGLDKDGSMLGFLYRLGAGYVVVGTALHRPHKGNPGTPWLPLSASHAAINALGLPSPGIDVIVENIQKFRVQYKPHAFPIGLSVMGHPLDDDQAKNHGIITCIQKAQNHVDFIEINQSCPNVGEDLTKLDVPEACFEFDLPIVLKLQPMKPNSKILQLCAEGKIDALVIGNTTKDYQVDRLATVDQRHAEYFRYKHGGGLSGAPLRSQNLSLLAQWKDALAQCQAATHLIGCGGIMHPSDVQAYLAYGPLCQLYTGVWSSLATQGARKSWAWLLSDL
jgi:dihydroorotate dehydrogenase